MALARLVAAVIDKLTLTNWGAPQTTNLGVRSSNLCAPGDRQGVVGESPTR
jgi:hypothetical protein